jgi:Ca-activated chloride channel homolog
MRRFAFLTPVLIVIASVLALSPTIRSAAQGSTTYIQLILDASGSMYGKLPAGGTRISAAKDVLSSFINKLPADPNLNVGLRIYGANTAAGSAEACTDSKLVLPMKGLERAALQETITRTKPKGSTPIAYSLEQAALDFPVDNSRKLIVLVTDGQESCRGDLKKVVEAFKARGIEVDLRIIGIDLDANAQKSFEGIGKFENATSSAELASALGRATEAVAKPSEAKLPVTVKLTSSGKPVTSGAKVSFSSALDEKTSTDFIPGDGAYKAELIPGTYNAKIETADSGVQNFAGLSVAVGASNSFSFEVGQVSTVKLEFTPNPPIAGGKVTASFSGAPNTGSKDWVAIAQKTDPDRAYYDWQYVKGVSGTLDLKVPDEQIEYELRYHLANPDGSTRVIGRSASFTPKRVAVSLEAPNEALAGSSIQVKWTGPNNDLDYVTVVKKGAPEGAYLDYKYTKQGNPLSITMPPEAGEFEIRYASDDSRKTLASRPITLKSASYALEAANEVVAGSQIKVTWTGPNNKGDYVTIVKKGAAVGTYLGYFYTRDGNPGTLTTPLEAGEYELRYSTEAASPNPTLASRPIQLTGATYKLEAPREGKAGTKIQVKWSGPNGRGDYVTIVKKGAPVGTYTNYFYTRDGNPGTITLPKEPGEYELRYSTEAASPNPTLHSIPITVK